MIVVKPQTFNFFSKVDLQGYANAISLYLKSTKGNINNTEHLDVLFLDEVRKCIDLEDLDIKIDFNVELRDNWTGMPLLGKNQIDLIVKKSNSEILLQKIINDDKNFDINNLILESTKLCLEDGDFKHIIFCCAKTVFESYIKNYGINKKYNIYELSNILNFRIENLQSSTSCFELRLVNNPIDIEENLLLSNFQIILC
jgi:hypothetical protein